jgi:flagellar biosynthetic protein FliR
MHPSLPDLTSTAIVAACAGARVAAAVGAAAAVLPGLTVRIRLALVIALVAVALPAAVASPEARDAASTVARSPGLGSLALLVAGELFVGLAMGTAVAAVASAGGWAGGILGSVAGLSWADDFDPEGDAQSAGMARLAWWISCGAFLTSGGLLAIVAGLIDSVRIMPVGTVIPTAVADLAVRLPAVGLSLAVTLAVPALVAVIAFHLTTAICLRTVPFAPGPGLLQALAALVLLSAVYAGADAWSAGFGRLLQAPLERCFDTR